MINAYPLAWPEGWPRTPSHRREHGRFRTAKRNDVTVAEGVERVLEELRRMGRTRDDIVVSTNLVTRMDGMPRSDQREPQDAGAAVYWQLKDGSRKVMAIDRYHRVADNLAAIAATLEAMRAIERHGGAQILDRAFTGFTAITDARVPWWTTLGVTRTTTVADVRAAYRRLRSQHHPDNGGTAAAFDAVEKAWAAHCAEMGTAP